jgi:hypothetical protein
VAQCSYTCQHLYLALLRRNKPPQMYSVPNFKNMFVSIKISSENCQIMYRYDIQFNDKTIPQRKLPNCFVGVYTTIRSFYLRYPYKTILPFPLPNSFVAELYIVPRYDLAIFTANFFLLTNVYLGLGTPHIWGGLFPRKEGKIQVLAGVAALSQTERR